MPLNKPALQAQLQALFVAPGNTFDAVAVSWASAVQAYAAGIVPPSAAVAAASSALRSALTVAFAATNAVPGMESAFQAFALAVGGGMAGYAPVPPPGPVGFAALFSQPLPSSHAEAANRIATLIHSWLTTGTSSLVAPPNTVVPWS